MVPGKLFMGTPSSDVTHWRLLSKRLNSVFRPCTAVSQETRFDLDP
jgi:hypothetical protein